MYKEVNPAIFACVTFPFLFGVMFGDIAHGSLMLLTGIVLCLANSRLQGTSFEAAGQLRYMLLLMGFFATYMGFIYNEFFAIPLEIFGSCYDPTPTGPVTWNPAPNATQVAFPDPHYVRGNFDCVYTLGMDPRWFQTSNLLAYQNSLKMKTSVILGVLQMSLGICMKGFNALYFGAYVDFFFEFIPQISLLLALFGWMDTLIIGKWLQPVNVEGLELRQFQTYSNMNVT
jgi:V-type H+-transporting ATPase subunit a